VTTAAAGYWCPVPSGRCPLHAGRSRAGAGAGAGRFTVRGDASLLDRYFALVPPV